MANRTGGQILVDQLVGVPALPRVFRIAEYHAHYVHAGDRQHHGLLAAQWPTSASFHP